jgi:hypothetical protein
MNDGLRFRRSYPLESEVGAEDGWLYADKGVKCKKRQGDQGSLDRWLPVVAVGEIGCECNAKAKARQGRTELDWTGWAASRVVVDRCNR